MRYRVYKVCDMKVAQLCPTLCDPMDCSPPGSSVHAILQAKILERVAIAFPRGSFPPRDWTWVSCIAGRFFTVWATREAHPCQWWAWSVAISFSNAWKWKVKVKSLSHVQILATPWTAAYQAPPSMGFPRQEYWRGVPLPSPQSFIYLGLNFEVLKTQKIFPDSWS